MKTELVDLKVFPSEESTISVIAEDNEMQVGYENACHKYEIKNCIGFNNGKTEYVDSTQTVQFVQKNNDGTIIPGLQSEQVAYVILHRLETMNRLFPSPENEMQIAGLKMYLEGCELRVKNRIERNVMGELKK